MSYSSFYQNLDDKEMEEYLRVCIDLKWMMHA